MYKKIFLALIISVGSALSSNQLASPVGPVNWELEYVQLQYIDYSECLRRKLESLELLPTEGDCLNVRPFDLIMARNKKDFSFVHPMGKYIFLVEGVNEEDRARVCSELGVIRTDAALFAFLTLKSIAGDRDFTFFDRACESRIVGIIKSANPNCGSRFCCAFVPGDEHISFALLEK